MYNKHNEEQTKQHTVGVSINQHKHYEHIEQVCTYLAPHIQWTIEQHIELYTTSTMKSTHNEDIELSVHLSSIITVPLKRIVALPRMSQFVHDKVVAN